MEYDTRRLNGRRFFCLLALCVAGASLSATEWTSWLGTDGNRQAPTPDLSEGWPGSVELVWERPVGEGYGSPILAGETIFVHARQGDEEVVWKLDIKTGTPLWREAFPVPFEIGGGGAYHGKGPKSSPTYADGRLFTMSIDGTLSCFDAESGDLLWRGDHGHEFDESHPYWGATTSPLVLGPIVMAHFGACEDGAFVAHRVTDGAVDWRNESFGASYASPQHVVLGETPQVLEWNHDALVGVDASSGRALWSQPYPHLGQNQNMPTPILQGNRILVGGENRGMRAFDVVLDAGSWRVEEAWFQRRASLDMSTAVVSEGRVFGLTHLSGGRLFCLNPETGAMIWEGPSRVAEHATFLSGSGFVIALLNTGELEVLDPAADEYRTLASYRVSESATWAPPVMFEDGFLIKDRDSLRRLRFVVDEDTDTTPTL